MNLQLLKNLINIRISYVGLSEKERRRQYKQDHKEKVKEYKKNNYMKNRDYYLAYYKQWRQNKKQLL